MGLKTSLSTSTPLDWSEASDPLRFSVGDADIAIRVGFPMLQRMASSEKIPDTQIRVLAQTVEIRSFIQLEPIVTLSGEFEFVNDATAESLLRMLPFVIETLKSTVDARNRAVLLAFRKLKVERSGRVVRLSVKLPNLDTNKWVLLEKPERRAFLDFDFQG